MADEEETRLQRASDLAAKTARHEERVNARLKAHDRQFTLLNATVEKNGQRFDNMDKAIRRVGDSVDRLSESERVREAVSQALHKEVQRANEKQISRRQLWLAVAMVIATILAGFLATGHVFG